MVVVNFASLGKNELIEFWVKVKPDAPKYNFWVFLYIFGMCWWFFPSI